MSAARRPDRFAALKTALVDVERVLAGLGLLGPGRAKRRGPGAYDILCPWHGENSPSCRVSVRPHGAMQAHCFGCGETGDALDLIAAVHRLDPRSDREAIFAIGAQFAGLDLSGHPVPQPPPPVVRLAPLYPPESEVSALWAAAEPIEADPDLYPEADTTAARCLAGRAIDPGMVCLYQLARVLPVGAGAPSWARCRGIPWPRSHRLILPVVDHLGAVRSLRAWNIDGEVASDDTPKRVAPAGHITAGLVLACPVGRRMLVTGQAPTWATDAAPLVVYVVEGEPDFLTLASRVADHDETPPAVLGVVAGSWCEAIADRIPDGSRVVIRTHDDEAGLRYGEAIYSTLADRYAAGRLLVNVTPALATKLQESTAP